ALILVDVAFVAAIAEAGGRAVGPGDDVLRLVVAAIQFFGDIATEVGEKRRFQLRIRAAQQQRIAAGRLVGAPNSFPEQRFGFAWTGGAAEEAVFGARSVELRLAREGRVVRAQIHRFVR